MKILFVVCPIILNMHFINTYVLQKILQILNIKRTVALNLKWEHNQELQKNSDNFTYSIIKESFQQSFLLKIIQCPCSVKYFWQIVVPNTFRWENKLLCYAKQHVVIFHHKWHERKMKQIENYKKFLPKQVGHEYFSTL